MKKERIHLYLTQETLRALQEMARQPGEISAAAEELLQAGLSLKKGEMVEQQSLPVIRDIVQNELRKTVAQLRNDLREDMRLDLLAEIKTLGRRSDDRLAALIVKAIRDAGIGRRMIYALLAKTAGPNFTQEVFQDAVEKVGKDLASRTIEGTPA